MRPQEVREKRYKRLKISKSAAILKNPPHPYIQARRLYNIFNIQLLTYLYCWYWSLYLYTLLNYCYHMQVLQRQYHSINLLLQCTTFMLYCIVCMYKCIKIWHAIMSSLYNKLCLVPPMMLGLHHAATYRYTNKPTTHWNEQVNVTINSINAQYYNAQYINVFLFLYEHC